MYLAANVALPFYYRKYRRAEFSPVKHVGAARGLGVAVVGIPIYYLFNPSPPDPAI